MNRRVLSRFALAIIATAAMWPALPAHSAGPIPLPPPGQPVILNLTSTSALMTWSRPAGPVFRYVVQRLVNGQWL